MEFRNHPERRFRHYLSFPFIWFMLVPLIILDICLTFYHEICFSLYKIEKVDRNKYVIIDRVKLGKLKPLEKLNCLYCEYANGVLPFATEIAARTEQYWCGIKHNAYAEDFMPEHHKRFKNYNDYK